VFIGANSAELPNPPGFPAAFADAGQEMTLRRRSGDGLRVADLIARKEFGQAIEALKRQSEGRRPGPQVRLQLADLLILAGRREEAIPVLMTLADELAAEYFVAKAVAILKRVERIEPGRADVEMRLSALAKMEQAAPRPAPAPRVAPGPSFGMEEVRTDGPREGVAQEAPSAAEGPFPLQASKPAPAVRPRLSEPSPSRHDEEPNTAPAQAQSPVAPTEGSDIDLSTAPDNRVTTRIRTVMKRFLASLRVGTPTEGQEPASSSAGPAPPVVATGEPKGESSAAPPSAPTSSPVEGPPWHFFEDPEEAESWRAGPPVVALAPGSPSPETPPMSEMAFEDELLDFVEEILRRPPQDSRPNEPTQLRDTPRNLPYGRTLAANPLFADLSEEDLLAIMRVLRLATFEAGDIIITEGEPGNSLFILTSGAVKVFVRNPTGRNFEVGRLQEASFFGEISGLSGRPRTATITATEHCELLELHKTTVESIAKTHPRVRETLDASYIERASSPAAAAVRAVPSAVGTTQQKASEILEGYFGGARWEPRMRLRLAHVLVRAGKQEEALPILIGLADELAREGFPEKAIAILKRIERIQRRDIEELNLAPLIREKQAAALLAGLGVRGGTEADVDVLQGRASSRTEQRTEEFFQDWLVDLVRQAVKRHETVTPSQGKALGGATRARPDTFPGYGPGLRASPLFEGFCEDELLALVQALRLLTFEAGDIIITEGEYGESLFILTGGAVKVWVRSVEGRNVELCALGEGAFFGEISTLSGRPRSATITAATRCELLELDRATLDTISVTHPRVLEILEEYCRERGNSPRAASIRGGPVAESGAD